MFVSRGRFEELQREILRLTSERAHFEARCAAQSDLLERARHREIDLLARLDALRIETIDRITEMRREGFNPAANAPGAPDYTPVELPGEVQSALEDVAAGDPQLFTRLQHRYARELEQPGADAKKIAERIRAGSSLNPFH